MAGEREGQGKRAGFLKGFLSTAVFLLLVLAFVPVRYEANDDFGLVARFNPRSGFPTDSFQPVMSPTLGRVLCALYAWHPKVPWYGLVIYASIFGGLSLMLSTLFRATRGASLLLALPLLFILFFHLFAFVSFTAASLVLECAVLLCVLEWVLRGSCPASRPRWYAGALALGFLVAFLLRWHMALVAAAFGAPILLFLRKGQLRAAIPFLAAVGLALAGDRALFHLMSSEEHRAFLEYNRLRAQFHDTIRGEPHGEMTRRALAKAGWSPGDYLFYKSWVLYDNRRFNAQTLRAFLQENDPGKEDSLLTLGLEGFRRQFHLGNHYALALVFATLSILAYRLDDLGNLSKSMRRRISLALAVIAAGILTVMCFRFVPRVFVPLSAYFFGTGFLLFHLGAQKASASCDRPFRRRSLLLCAVIFSLLTWAQAFAQGKVVFPLLKGSKAEKAYVRQALSRVERRSGGSDPLLVLMSPVSGLGTESIHPLREFSDFTDLKVFPAGWGVHSPRFSSILKDMGLRDGWAFLKWMLDNPRVLLALRTTGGRDARRWKSLWESYFTRRIAPDKKVRLVPVHDFRNASGAGLVLFSARSGKGGHSE